MKPPARDAALTFDWPERERFPWFLFGFVMLSLAAHTGSFFLFQVIYPQRATIPPPAPQISVLAPTSPENEALLRWIDAEDPALVAGGNSVTPPDLLDVPYRPSFATLRTPPRGISEPAAVAQFPPARSPLDIIRSGEAHPPTAAPAAPAAQTVATFTPPLAARALLRPLDLSTTAKAAAPVEPTHFLLGVTDRGEVRFVFLQRSSGDPALDADAAARLTAAAFAPDPAPITWAHATIAWGDDAYTR